MAKKLTNRSSVGRSSVSRSTMPPARPNGYAAVNAAGHSEGYRPNVHAKASADMKLNIAVATARAKNRINNNQSYSAKVASKPNASTSIAPAKKSASKKVSKK